jgi:FtsZ-binding cell division protein ZapB
MKSDVKYRLNKIDEIMDRNKTMSDEATIERFRTENDRLHKENEELKAKLPV